MTAFLTSSTGNFIYDENGEKVPCGMSTENGFLENLKKYWKEGVRCLLISAAPEEYERNDGMKELFLKSYSMSGLSVAEWSVWDNRSDDISREELHEFDVLILSGGHVPTQSRFFEKIDLKTKIKDFPGIVIGISAGTMNSADLVYAMPELEGESEDSQYQRFISGLGLMDKMVIPHYQEIRNTMLDGKRAMEDIAYPDSVGREFYAIVDGSYFFIDSTGKVSLHGESYLVKDGKLTQLLENGESMEL